MTKHLLSIILVLSSISVRSQTNLFVSGTSWFGGNNDSSFFKADTIRLIRYAENNKEEDEASFLAGADFITLSLQKDKKLKLQSHLVESWSVTEKKGKYEWQFNRHSQKLKLYFNRELFCSFSILNIKPLKVKSKFGNKPSINTIEVSLKRLTTTNTALVK